MLNRAQSAHLIRESFAGFHRRKLTTGVTILIMGSALLVLAILTLATLNMGHMLESARAGIDMRVFLNDGLGPERMAALQPRLLAIPGVQKVAWISPETALGQFKEGLGEDAEIVDLLDANPLPASYHLTMTPGARNQESVEKVREEIAVWEEVSEILFNQGWIDALESWTFRFRMASLVVGLIVFVAAVFVISNTVKLTMASSARIIQIQKLVGATNAFIRTPYLCEGMIQGLLAGILAMGLLAAAGYVLNDRLGGLVFFTGGQIAGFILFCVVLGLTGSYSAMRKYLTMQSEI
ncbi:MAG: permease-like cell division protein FtsX [Candidatus Krumholzibacteriota bacterium]